ncbi:MAG: phytoene/squalene synthase family protein [Verrucomicrobiia bacterium]
MEGCLAASFEACRRITRRHAKSFSFSSLFLPHAKRLDACAVYAFCRHADDLLDLVPERGGDNPAAVLRHLLDNLYAGRSDGVDFGAAFHEVVTRHAISQAYFEELILGVCSDRGRVRIRDGEEFRVYCHRVAGVVGLIMARVFGLRDPTGEGPAADLGAAMQATNILRDVAEDAGRDRIYLPADEMARFGVSEAEVFARHLTPGMAGLVAHMAGRARELYRRSEAGIALLPDDGSRFCVWAMRWIYAGILDRLEARRWDVFAGRAHVDLPRKCALAFRAWHSARGAPQGA